MVNPKRVGARRIIRNGRCDCGNQFMWIEIAESGELVYPTRGFQNAEGFAVDLRLLMIYFVVIVKERLSL